MFSSPLGAHPIFSDVARHVNVDKDDRCEVSTRGMDPALVERALAITTGCCNCGRPIHPFRRRASPPERAAASTGPIYVSLVCPMSANPGCARGKAADSAKAALIHDVAVAKSQAQSTGENTYTGDLSWFPEWLETV